MELYEWLFIRNKISKESLTDIPTGQISIDAISNRQPKFFIDDKSEKWTPKKIILGNIDFNEMNSLEFFKFIWMLNSLIIDYQFEVYRLQDYFLKYTELRELGNLDLEDDEEDISKRQFNKYNQEILNSFFKSNQQDIQQCIVDNHLEGKVCIIDTHHAKELAKLLDSKLLEQMSLPAPILPSILIELSYLIEQLELRSEFASNSRNSLMEFSEKNTNLIFQESNEDTRETSLVFRQKLNIEEISSRLYKDKPYDCSIHFASIEDLNALKLNQFLFLKKLTIYEFEAPYAELLAILPTKLNELNLDGFKILKGPHEFKEELYIDSLSLSGITDTEHVLIKMLNHIKNIQYLRLDNVNIPLNYGSMVKLKKLKNLKKLKIYTSRQSISLPVDFLKILFESPSLEHLVISSIDSQIFLEAIEQIPVFPNLRKFDYDGPDRVKIFKALEAKAPLLELQILKESENVVDHSYNNQTNSSNQKKEQEPIVEVNHDPQRFYDERKEPNEWHFKNLKGLNQGMVIDKFCQYQFLSNGLDMKQIISLQKGICQALSHYCNSLGYTSTQTFLKHASAWDGYSQLSSDLSKNFDELRNLIDRFYLKRVPESFPILFIPHQLSELVERPETLILSNPWHAISVQKHSNGWYVYDPNHLGGPQNVSNKKALLEFLSRSLGTLIFMENDLGFQSTPIQIPDINQFLEHGGLLALVQMTEQQQKELIDLMTHRLDLSEKSLFQGLQIRDLNNKKIQDIIPSCPNLQKFLETQYIKGSTSELLYRTLKPQSKDTPPLTNLLSYKNTLINNNSEHEIIETTAEGLILKLLSEASKTLIRVDSKKILNELRDGIQQIAKDTHRNLFYVHQPQDLQLNVNRFKVAPSGGVVVDKNSVFADFLNQEQEQEQEQKVILINYELFTAEDIVAFNELLDKQPQINGKPIPNNIQIIGLQNIKKEDAYQGSDFYSRFSKKIDWPEYLATNELTIALPIGNENEGTRINLYDDAGWKEILFGGIRLNDTGYDWYSGVIEKLPQCLILENTPWEDEEFQEFWRQAILKKEIELYGKKWKIPKEFQLVPKNGYQWQQYNQVFTEEFTEIKILNSSFLYEFIGGQTLKEGRFIYVDGCLKNEKQITILLTQELPEGKWARLLDECLKCGTQLNVLRLGGINVPQPLEGFIKPFNLETALEIIQTTDIERCAAEYPKPSLIIDVSDFTPQDLFGYTEIDFKSSEIIPHFEYKPSWLFAKLKQGTQIVLKGHLSKRIAEYICHEILMNEELSRNLCIITDIDSPLKGIPSQIIDYRAEEQKKNTQLDYLIHAQPIVEFSKLSTNTEQATKDFQTTRKKIIEEALAQQNFVIVTGLSGCGKTTFIQKTFNPLMGEKDILNWIQNQNSPNYLFFDEANLTANDWLIFAGLMQQPPHMIYKGQYFELTPHHKVIFAINPLSYGDERHLPKLFEMNPNVVVFEPIPADSMYEEILKPLLQNTVLESHAREIAEVIFEVYREVLGYSNTKILISPRECQSMVLLTLTKYLENPSLNPCDLAKFYAFSIAQNCVPERYQNTFTEKFKCINPSVKPQNLQDYVITPSREPVINYLKDLMSLRTYRQSQKSALNTPQLTGGLGGLIIEGEPGIGKSELLIQTLTQDYHLKKATPENQEHDEVFYCIPTNISIAERKSLLLEAFHKGAVVIIDEMNSGPMLESFLNALLMGYTPEGIPAKKPGFTILATQNPATRSGRRQQSEAILRRMLKFNLDEYTKSEMLEILVPMNIDELSAHCLIDIYLECKAYAQKNYIKPEPNFRDFLRFVRNIQEHDKLPSQSLLKDAWAWNSFSAQLDVWIEQHFSNDFIQLFIEQVNIIPNSNIEENKLIIRDCIKLGKLKDQIILKTYLNKWLKIFPESSDVLLGLLKSIDDGKSFQTICEWIREAGVSFSDEQVLNLALQHIKEPDKLKVIEASLMNEKVKLIFNFMQNHPIDWSNENIEILSQVPKTIRHQIFKKHFASILGAANKNESIRKQLIEFFKEEKYDLFSLKSSNIDLSQNLHDDIFEILSDQTHVKYNQNSADHVQKLLRLLNTNDRVSHFLKINEAERVVFLIRNSSFTYYQENHKVIEEALYSLIDTPEKLDALNEKIKAIDLDSNLIKKIHNKFYELRIKHAQELTNEFISSCKTIQNLESLLAFDTEGKLRVLDLENISAQIITFNKEKSPYNSDYYLSQDIKQAILKSLLTRIEKAHSSQEIGDILNYKFDDKSFDIQILVALMNKNFVIPEKRFSWWHIHQMLKQNLSIASLEPRIQLELIKKLFEKSTNQHRDKFKEFFITIYNSSITNKDNPELPKILQQHTQKFIHDTKVPLKFHQHIFNAVLFILAFTVIIPLIVRYHYTQYFYTSDTDLSKVGEEILNSLKK